MADKPDIEETTEALDCIEVTDETIVHQEEPMSESQSCVLCPLT